MATMTAAQLSVLDATIKADPIQSVNAAVANYQAITDWLNTPDPANTMCWRTSLTQDEVWDVMDWTVLINRSQGERDAFRLLWSVRGTVNPSRQNVRRAFSDIFSGAAAGAAALRQALMTLAQRRITIGEKLFAVPSADVSTVLTLVVEGPFSTDDVKAALGV